jgi:hypothetical protein
MDRGGISMLEAGRHGVAGCGGNQRRRGLGEEEADR